MRSIFICGLLLSATPWAARAQVGVGTTTPHAKAALDISATGKGLLIPRMDSATRAQIASPPDGLMVFQTDFRKGFWYAIGGSWVFIPDKARSGDNLGNHTATQSLSLGSNALTGTGASIIGLGLGVRADGGLNLGQNTPGNNFFLGYQAGASTTYNSANSALNGSMNHFAGFQAGAANTTGYYNYFSGYRAGQSSTVGNLNVIVGAESGYALINGGANVFVGAISGHSVTTGNGNTLIGALAHMENNLQNATAIGYDARVRQSNSLVLGGTGSNAVNVGIGTGGPLSRLSISPNDTEAKITLWDGGSTSNHYGLGISANQLNYHVAGPGDSHVFYATGKNGDGAELLRIQGDGSVGIGTPSPQNQLHLHNASFARARISAASGQAGISFLSDNSGETVLYSPAGSNDLRAYVGGFDRMVVTNDGTVGINSLSPGTTYRLYVNGTGGATGGFVTASDARFKTNIKPMNNALGLVSRLRGVSYNLRRAEFPAYEFPKGTQLGFLAQEVQQVLPEAVLRNDDGYLGVNYQMVVPVLVEALKELQGQVDAERARADRAEAQTRADHADLQTLKAQLARLLEGPAATPLQARR